MGDRESSAAAAAAAEDELSCDSCDVADVVTVDDVAAPQTPLDTTRPDVMPGVFSSLSSFMPAGRPKTDADPTPVGTAVTPAAAAAAAAARAAASPFCPYWAYGGASPACTMCCNQQQKRNIIIHRSTRDTGAHGLSNGRGPSLKRGCNNGLNESSTWSGDPPSLGPPSVRLDWLYFPDTRTHRRLTHRCPSSSEPFSNLRASKTCAQQMDRIREKKKTCRLTSMRRLIGNQQPTNDRPVSN